MTTLSYLYRTLFKMFKYCSKVNHFRIISCNNQRLMEYICKFVKLTLREMHGMHKLNFGAQSLQHYMALDYSAITYRNDSCIFVANDETS